MDRGVLFFSDEIQISKRGLIFSDEIQKNRVSLEFTLEQSRFFLGASRQFSLVNPTLLKNVRKLP